MAVALIRICAKLCGTTDDGSREPRFEGVLIFVSDRLQRRLSV